MTTNDEKTPAPELVELFTLVPRDRMPPVLEKVATVRMFPWSVWPDGLLWNGRAFFRRISSSAYADEAGARYVEGLLWWVSPEMHVDPLPGPEQADEDREHAKGVLGEQIANACAAADAALTLGDAAVSRLEEMRAERDAALAVATTEKRQREIATGQMDGAREAILRLTKERDQARADLMRRTDELEGARGELRDLCKLVAKLAPEAPDADAAVADVEKVRRELEERERA